MQKLTGLVLILAGLAPAALACGVVSPEIDASTAVSAVAVVAGAVLIIRARRKV